jgi:hypothetical protein
VNDGVHVVFDILVLVHRWIPSACGKNLIKDWKTQVVSINHSCLDETMLDIFYGASFGSNN